MDDTCAVCADTLEWVAYGQCGHDEVCSTCIARLRFICNDRHCCICKSESSVIFVTKALGKFTRKINDFSVFPTDPSEGQVGPYWFDECTQAFFEDLSHYKAIKAMCKLSCIVCDNMDEQRNEGSKRRGEFRNVEQLKSHLFHRHKLFMCSLCLESRKIFIREQKLYTRAHLKQHINTGDSVVDGSENERGGFTGHPICEFCKDPFYGENELYTHMSTEHYTCHICQRRQPGHYEYYRNYDDLEIHFGREHFLCEDEACLAKKFIVFSTESEMKRHNATEHGGRMSRSKRNAVLQIPTSFLYQRSGEQDPRGRGRGFLLDSSDSQLSMALQASLETANAQSHASSSSGRADLNRSETSEINLNLGVSSSAPLEESSFPPLPGAKKSSKQKSKKVKKPGKNTMAAHLRRGNQGTVTVLNTSRAWPAASHEPISSTSSSSHLKPISNSVSVSSSGSAGSSMNNRNTVNGFVESNYTNSAKNSLRVTSTGFVSASSASASASAPNNVGGGHFGPSTSDFPPIASTQQNKPGLSSQPLQKVEDVRTANKSLVERIRAGLGFDDDKYAAFKVILADYRKGTIDTYEYIAYVRQFGLSHLVLELGKLCPDAQKQKELLEACSTSLKNNSLHEDNSAPTSIQSKGKKSSKKGKEKCEENGIGGSRVSLADSIITSLKELQSNYNPSEVEVEVLSKDGYRSAKGKSKVPVFDELAHSNSFYQTIQTPVESRIENHPQSADGGSKQDLVTEGGGNKQRKKTSKFHRVRLGDSSPATLIDHTTNHGPDPVKSKRDEKKEGAHKGLPVRGVWQNEGGRKLVAMTRRDLKR